MVNDMRTNRNCHAQPHSFIFALIYFTIAITFENNDDARKKMVALWINTYKRKSIKSLKHIF